jgi:hypothetical protein
VCCGWHRIAGHAGGTFSPERAGISSRRASGAFPGATSKIIDGNSPRAVRELPSSLVELADPDTLTVTTPWLEISQPSALAELAELFLGDEFDGMQLTLRLSMSGCRVHPGHSVARTP